MFSRAEHSDGSDRERTIDPEVREQSVETNQTKGGNRDVVLQICSELIDDITQEAEDVTQVLEDVLQHVSDEMGSEMTIPQTQRLIKIKSEELAQEANDPELVRNVANQVSLEIPEPSSEEEEEVCVLCVEPGQLIKPCNCHRDYGLYHYECVGNWMVTHADLPCTACNQPFKDPRIERKIYEPPIWEVLAECLVSSDHREAQIFTILVIGLICLTIALKFIGFGFLSLLVFAISIYFMSLLDDYYKRFYAYKHGQTLLHEWPEAGYPNNIRVIDLTQARHEVEQQLVEPLLQGIQNDENV